jgi:nucleoside-diphosphate-sugar epimerase
MLKNPIIRSDMRKILSAKIPWEKLRGETVLISGGASGAAAYLVLSLCVANEEFSLGLRVLCLVRNVDLARSKFGHYIGRSVTLMVQDVCVPLPKDAPEADFVVHAASPASSKYFSNSPVTTIGANTLGTWNLLDFARRSKSKAFLFFSSGEVYGNNSSTDGVVREDSYGYLDPTQNRACYGEGKRAGEAMCSAWNLEYDLRTCSARLFGVYGPSMKLTDGRVIGDFMTDVLRDRSIRIASDGKARRTYCYETDATIAIFTLLLNDSALGPYNIGNPDTVISIAGLAEIFSRIRDKKPPLGVEVPPELKITVSSEAGIRFPEMPDISRIGQLGWRPQISLQEGLRRMHSFYSKTQ